MRPELARLVAGGARREALCRRWPSQGNGGSGEIIALGHLFGALSSRVVEDSREAMSLINGSPCASALVADAALSGRNRLGLRPSASARSPPRPSARRRSSTRRCSRRSGTSSTRSRRCARCATCSPAGSDDRRPFQAPVSFRILPRVLGRLRRADRRGRARRDLLALGRQRQPRLRPAVRGAPARGDALERQLPQRAGAAGDGRPRDRVGRSSASCWSARPSACSPIRPSSARGTCR